MIQRSRLFDEVCTLSPAPMAFLLFVIGMALLIFEFFTAGVGIGGESAQCAFCSVATASALCRRDRWRTVLVLSMLAFAIDVQVGTFPIVDGGRGSFCSSLVLGISTDLCPQLSAGLGGST